MRSCRTQQSGLPASSTAINQLKARSTDEIASGRLSVRQVAIEEFTLLPGEEPFDLVFAIRVSALDGRHPQTGQAALDRIAAATHRNARLFIGGGHPLRELLIPKPT